MVAMQRSYKGLKEEGSDLKYCEGNQIKHFFEQLGLKESFDFDTHIEKFSKEEVEHESNDQES